MGRSPDIEFKNIILEMSQLLLDARAQLLINNPLMSYDKATICILTRCICKKFKTDLDYRLLSKTWDYDDVCGICLIDTYINHLVNTESFDLLIPYALEVLEYDKDELNDSTRDRRNGIRTKKKKTKGIFYTPLDVIDRMADICIKSMDLEESIEKSFIDFSCGSGLFLRAILERAIRSYDVIDEKQLCRIVRESIFGVDYSEIAVICSRFTLLNTLGINGLNLKSNYNEISEILNCNIATCDGTLGVHPNFTGKKFGCVIGNPPYLKIGSGNLFLPFVNNMMESTGNHSISSLVVPLSITYGQSKDYCKLREKISTDKSEWIFENYDRSPDSLFGDDVKTRNTILIRYSGGNRNIIKSTGLVRWTSKRRSCILKKRVSLETIPSDCIIKGVPKIGIPGSFIFFTKLTDGNQSLMDLVCAHETSYCMYVKETAYNWICAYNHLPPAFKNGDLIEAPGFRRYYFTTEDDLYYALAILNSKLTYWVWTITGDGFHTSSSLLKKITIYPSTYSGYRELSDLGKKLSDSLINFPIIIKNAGIIVQSYDPSYCMENTICDIDLKVCSIAEIPVEFKKEIDCWYSQHKKCERD